MDRLLCHRVKPVEKLRCDKRDRHGKGRIDEIRIFLAATRSLLDLFFKFVVAGHSRVATRQPNVRATQHLGDHRMLLPEFGTILPLECLPIRDANVFFATSATLGKQRRRGSVSCGGTDQDQESVWNAQTASSHASVPETTVFPEQRSK